MSSSKPKSKAEKSRTKRGGGRAPPVEEIASERDLLARNQLEKLSEQDALESDVGSNSDLEDFADLTLESTPSKKEQQGEDDDKYEDVFRIQEQPPVFEKDKSLTVQDIIASSAAEMTEEELVEPMTQSDNQDAANGEEDVELSQEDMERLEEVRRERQRAKLRREHEAKKKEELRRLAAERAEKLKEKGGKPKKKKGGKKR